MNDLVKILQNMNDADTILRNLIRTVTRKVEELSERIKTLEEAQDGK